MIFFSTLGGILMFGFPGLFIGPVIASLFISIWEIYGVEFAGILPDVHLVLVDLDEHCDADDLRKAMSPEDSEDVSESVQPQDAGAVSGGAGVENEQRIAVGAIKTDVVA